MKCFEQLMKAGTGEGQWSTDLSEFGGDMESDDVVRSNKELFKAEKNRVYTF